jgi:hypothetical protein
MRFLARGSAFVAALFLGSCAAETCSAALIAYDGFEATTNGGLNTQSGGTGWTSSWSAVSGIDANANTLSYSNGSVAVNGGSRATKIGATTDSTNAANRSFASQSGTVYFSFLFRADTGTAVDTDDFISFMMNNDTVNTDSAGIGKPNNGSLNLGARVGTSNGGDTTDSTTALVAGTTYFLVGKVSKTTTNYDRVDLFINPSSNIEPGLASVTDSAMSAFSTISFFSLRTLTVDGTDNYQFDELRVGTTFADVVPLAVPVPEPGTMIALSLAAGLGYWTKRRSPRAS